MNLGEYQKTETALYTASHYLERKFRDESRSESEIHALYAALSGLRSAEHKIIEGLYWVTERAAGVERDLARDGSMNELGEFQGCADRVDAAIAARALAWDVLAALLTDEELGKFRADRQEARESVTGTRA